ncbi:MAG: hypothetical protein Q7J16_00560 [Candidatus Cloacimonadales bacterium]|nr:hypothetical protein [Candidatus Cloacimonadales bacterium]
MSIIFWKVENKTARTRRNGLKYFSHLFSKNLTRDDRKFEVAKTLPKTRDGDMLNEGFGK